MERPSEKGRHFTPIIIMDEPSHNTPNVSNHVHFTNLVTGRILLTGYLQSPILITTFQDVSGYLTVLFGGNSIRYYVTLVSKGIKEMTISSEPGIDGIPVVPRMGHGQDLYRVKGKLLSVPGFRTGCVVW